MIKRKKKTQMVILDSLAKGHQKSFNQMVIPDSLAKEHKSYSSPHRTSYSLEKTHVRAPKSVLLPAQSMSQ